MPKIRLDQIEEGMTTSADVLNQRGQVLIPAGTALEGHHIRGLKKWKIDFAPVQASDLPFDDALASVDEKTRLQVAALQNRLVHCNINQLEHPLFAQTLPVVHDGLLRHGLSEQQVSFDLKKNNDSAEPEPALPNVKRHLITVELLLQNARSVSSPPDVYTNLMRVMKRPMSSSSDVAEVIKKDPGLTTRLLHIVNSAFYALQNKIETVSRAITIIGTQELSDLVLATSVLQSFGANLDGIFDMKVFWRHSLFTASFARALGQRCRLVGAEKLFVMGLLHDIGRLVIVSQLPIDTQEVLSLAAAERISVVAAEKKLLGFTHDDVGKAIAVKWNLPEVHREAIGNHHAPRSYSRFPMEEAIVHIADLLATIVDTDSWGEIPMPILSADAWSALRVKEDILPLMLEEVSMDVENMLKMGD